MACESLSGTKEEHGGGEEGRRNLLRDKNKIFGEREREKILKLNNKNIVLINIKKGQRGCWKVC